MATTLSRPGLQAGTALATVAEQAPAGGSSPMLSGCPLQVQALLTAVPCVRAWVPPGILVHAFTCSCLSKVCGWLPSCQTNGGQRSAAWLA